MNFLAILIPKLPDIITRIDQLNHSGTSVFKMIHPLIKYGWTGGKKCRQKIPVNNTQRYSSFQECSEAFAACAAHSKDLVLSIAFLDFVSF